MVDPTGSEDLRLFIAVRVAESVKAELARMREALRQEISGPHIRWTGTEQLHLTLKFLGDVQSGRVGGLTAAIQKASAGFHRLDLVAKGVGTFPQRGAPRVIWAGVRDPAAKLIRLQQAIEFAVREFTAEEPVSDFHGHITLARVKRVERREGDAILRAITARRDHALGGWEATEIELMQSELSSSTVRYSTLARIGL